MHKYLALALGASILPAASALAQPAQPDWSDARPVDIILSNFAFTPETLRLQHGRAYRLHLVNQGSGGHNFAAPDFFSQARIDPADASAIKDGKIELKKGEARDVRLIPAQGSYRVKCTHFLHTGFGMKGAIVVE
jgi:plastocyanin